MTTYKKTTTTVNDDDETELDVSSSGAVTASWTGRTYIENVDVQPVSNEILRKLEGSREEIKYQCIVEGFPASQSGGLEIYDGDRVYDPIPRDATGSVPEDPDMEIFGVKQFWTYGTNMPGHTEFFLRKVTGVIR